MVDFDIIFFINARVYKLNRPKSWRRLKNRNRKRKLILKELILKSWFKENNTGYKRIDFVVGNWNWKY